METKVDEAGERRKEKLKKFPPGSPMIPFVDMIQNPDAPLFPGRPSTRGSLTMLTEEDARDLHGFSRQGKRQPRHSRRGRRARWSKNLTDGGGGDGGRPDTDGGYSTGDGGYSTGPEDRATTAGTMTMHAEEEDLSTLPFFIPHGSRRPDPRYSLGYGSDGDGWEGDDGGEYYGDEYYAGGVGMLVNEAGKEVDRWGSLGMGLDFAPQARSRAETWINNEVKATLADIQREEKRAGKALIAERELADAAEKRAAKAAAAYRPTVRRSANTSNMTMTHVDEEPGPRLTHAQQRIALEEMRAAHHAASEAHVARIKEKHKQSLEKFKTQESESKSKLRKAGAVAKRELLQDVEAARGAATRGNRWSVVVERHRALRKVGRREERVFATSFGRQQAALGKQITAAELRHRGALGLGHAAMRAAAGRIEDAERLASVKNQKTLKKERAREVCIVMGNDLDIAVETMRETREKEAEATRDKLVATREKKKELKKTGKRAPDRDVLKMTKVSSATE